MSKDSFRKRKNGLIELRFRYNSKTYSVYGRTEEECLAKKEQKRSDLQKMDSHIKENSTVYSACLRFCDNAVCDGTVHEEGYRSLIRTARFIGRKNIGSLHVEELNDAEIERFRAEIANYSIYTIKKAVNMLKNIKKG